MISRSRTVFLAVCIVCAYVVWGALISIPPTFYPTEAENKGAAPAQVSDSCILVFILLFLKIIFKSMLHFINQIVFNISFSTKKYGSVFGIANIAAFISAPFFGVYGTTIGAKILYNFGALLQALAGIAFAFLAYVDNTAAFLGMSYLLR